MRIITLVPVSSALDMFDYTTDTQTSVAEEIEESFDCSGCNSVVILNNYCISATLSVVDDDTLTEYYTETVDMIRDSIKDWWDYFFAPCRTGRDLVFYFEAKTNSTATITLSYPGGTAKCGFCCPGVAVESGKTRYGVDIGITDYSVVDTNDFGVSFLAEGVWAKRADANINILNSQLDTIHSVLVSNRGTAAVYDFNNYQSEIDAGHTSLDGLQSLIVYGYYERFTPEIDRPNSGEYGLQVQGLI